MRTRTAALVLAASALTVGPPAVAHAAPAPQAAPVVTADNNDSDNDSGSDAGKWGLAGLAGLLGLAGLAQAGRKRHDHRMDGDGVNGTARDTRR